MEIFGLLMEVLAFVVELTIHGAVFLFLLVLAIFSPRYRSKLKLKWQTSAWGKFTLVLGTAFYMAALIFGVLFWSSAWSKPAKESDGQNTKSSLTIRFTKKVTPPPGQAPEQ